MNKKHVKKQAKNTGKSSNTKIELFDIYADDMQSVLLNLHRTGDIKKYRQKEIVAGKVLEVDIYPIWNTSKKSELKAIKKNKAHINEVNHRNRERKLTQLANENFTSSDIWITLGYRGADNPKDYAQAVKDKNNYLRRLKRSCVKNGYSDLKVLGVVEVSKSGRYHIHMMTNFPDRDLAEKLWDKGKYPQARRLQPNDVGLTGLAKYLSKDLKDGKTYFATTNLKKPWLYAKTSDTKVTRLKAKQIAKEQINAREYFESKFTDYEFTEIETKASTVCDGVYLYIKMKRRE